MDLCHLNKHSEPQSSKYNGRVVLQSDLVEDDSGSHAVFKMQWSSASQMTAAKSHGHHFKTARLRTTSSRRSIRLYSGQNTRCTDVIDSKVRMSRYLNTTTRNTNGQNHCPVWEIQLFLLSGICTVIFWQDYYGKGNLRKSY